MPLASQKQEKRVQPHHRFAHEFFSLIGKLDMLGKNVWDFVLDTDEKIVHNNLERVIAQQVDVSFELYYPNKDRWYEHRMYPSIEGGASIFTLDITARRKSEERISILAKVFSFTRAKAIETQKHAYLRLLCADWPVAVVEH